MTAVSLSRLLFWHLFFLAWFANFSSFNLRIFILPSDFQLLITRFFVKVSHLCLPICFSTQKWKSMGNVFFIFFATHRQLLCLRAGSEYWFSGECFSETLLQIAHLSVRFSFFNLTNLHVQNKKKQSFSSSWGQITLVSTRSLSDFAYKVQAEIQKTVKWTVLGHVFWCSDNFLKSRRNNRLCYIVLVL